ncbi:hypothetical protein [Thermofilum sp.]|uniref:hypothetical protein n=1 Tax=Thermofilum sp. TaxID=1961369 RepID=UPI00315ED115
MELKVARVVCPRCGAIKAFFTTKSATVKCSLCGLRIISGGKAKNGAMIFDLNDDEIYRVSEEKVKEFFASKGVVKFKDRYGRECRVFLYDYKEKLFAISVKVGGEEIKLIYDFFNVPYAVRMLKIRGEANPLPLIAVEYGGKIYLLEEGRTRKILLKSLAMNVKPEIAALLL